MSKVRHSLLPALLLALAPVTHVAAGVVHEVPARAQPGTNHAGRPAAHEIHRNGISLDEAVARAEQKYRARVVRTDVVDEDGRKVYVLKLLSEDGRVFTVRIDAATGGMR